MVEDILPQLQRQKTGLAEFHCMIVRTEIFQQIGVLDEKIHEYERTRRFVYACYRSRW